MVDISMMLNKEKVKENAKNGISNVKWMFLKVKCFDCMSVSMKIA